MYILRNTDVIMKDMCTTSLWEIEL